jgi:flagellar hook assembly protein FlgD
MKKLQIFDASGRLIKSFPLLTTYSLLPTIVWSGTDQNGRAVPAGVYFLKAETATDRRVIKIVKTD